MITQTDMFITSNRRYEARKYTWSVMYTSSGAWTSPINGDVIVECWGGGSSGDWGALAAGGEGGVGGWYSRKTINVNAGASYQYVIGNGGIAVISSNRIKGGDTYFGSSDLILAAGGLSTQSCVGEVTYSGGIGGTGQYTNNGKSGGGGGSAFSSSVGGNGQNWSGALTASGGSGTGAGGSGGAYDLYIGDYQSYYTPFTAFHGKVPGGAGGGSFKGRAWNGSTTYLLDYCGNGAGGAVRITWEDYTQQ